MDKTTQLEILARALLGGLVELHGREHAAHVLERLAEGVRTGQPVAGRRRCCPSEVKPTRRVRQRKLTDKLAAPKVQ